MSNPKRTTSASCRPRPKRLLVLFAASAFLWPCFAAAPPGAWLFGQESGGAKPSPKPDTPPGDDKKKQEIDPFKELENSSGDESDDSYDEDRPIEGDIEPRPRPPEGDEYGDEESMDASYYSPPSSRQAQFVLAAAEKAAHEGKYSEATVQFQRVIDDYANKVLSAPDRVYIGVRERAIAGLKSLAEAGRRAYLERFEPKAKTMLEAALASREKSAFVEILRRYPLTVSAREALIALGNLHMERGEAAEARHYFEAALTHPAADEASRVRARAALVLVASVLRDRDFLESARSDASAASESISIGGRESSVGDLAQQALKKLDASPAPVHAAKGPSWPSFGGDASCNRSMSPAGDRRTRQWFQMLELPTEAPRGYDASDFGMGEVPDNTPFSPFQPVVGNGTVYVQNGLRVDAFQLYNGKLRWRQPSPQPCAHSTSPSRDRRLVYAPALDQDRLFAAIEVPNDLQPLNWSFHHIVVPLPERKLFAFDAESGAIVWSHFGFRSSDPEEDLFIRQASVVSPPLVVGDTLYAIGSYFEGKIHCYLCAFDKHTGHLLWKTLLCTGQQELNMFGRPWREYSAGPICERDGILYVSTNLGLVAAVDRRLGAVLWLSTYKQLPIQPVIGYQPIARALAWYANPPIVSGDTLYVTPQDSDWLVALDVASGKKRFEYKRTMDLADLRYLLGVRKGLVLLAGDKVVAVDAATGVKRWDFRFPEAREMAIGRGGATDDVLFFGSSRAVYSLNIATGKLLQDRVTWPEDGGEPGNMVSAGLFFVVASERRCQVFYQWDRVFEELSSRIAQNPDDPELLLEVGNVFKQGLEYGKAAESFERALDLAMRRGADDSSVLGARRGLHDVHTTLGELAWKKGDYEKAEASFRKAAENAFDPGSRVKSFLNFAKCYELKGDVKGLIDVYRTMVREVGDATLGSEAEPKYAGMKAGLYALLKSAEKLVGTGDKEGAVAVYQEIIRDFPAEIVGGDSTARAVSTDAIGGLIRDGGAQVYAPFEDRARSLYQVAAASKDEARFREVLALYPNSSVLEPCLLDLGKLLIEKEAYGKAAGVLRDFLLTFPESALENDVLKNLALCYEKKGFFSSAMASLARTPEGSDERKKAAADQRFQPPAPLAPSLGHPLKERFKKTFNSAANIVLIDLVGAPSEYAGSHLFFHSNRTLTCLRLEDGEVLWTRPNVDDFQSSQEADIHWVDGTLVFATHRSIVSLDPDTGDVRWQLEPDLPMRGAKFTAGTALTVLENPSENGTFILRAHDLMTGDKVWEDFVRGKFYGDLIVTESYAVVHTQNPMRITVYDSFTGRRHWEVAVGPNYSMPSALEGDRLFVFGRNSEFQTLDLRKKSVLWSRPVEGVRVRNVLSLGSDSAVLVSRTDPDPTRPSDEIRLLSGADGSTRWTTPIEEGGYVYPASREQRTPSGTIYLNRRDKDSSFYLMAFSREKGELKWQAQPLQGSSPPKTVIEAGGIVVLEIAYYNPADAEPKLFVLLIDSASGKTLDKREYAGNMSSHVQVVGGTLCVAVGKQITAYAKEKIERGK